MTVQSDYVAWRKRTIEAFIAACLDGGVVRVRAYAWAGGVRYTDPVERKTSKCPRVLYNIVIKPKWRADAASMCRPPNNPPR